ncbi:tetratricopeptide repeat protein [Umezawaea tangerina]|uniref:Tetratricopeptide repeat protein n=1 Tax=Umezawaea tangerina TaxID=84725 RepID=A0A2T0SN82_9PSEU|nr:tetratricopeptide repeat protein [Umezawaea tangerina]PRY34855.1 tetratricopeptide repeat protein [Umezawaea tangerina]
MKRQYWLWSAAVVAVAVTAVSFAARSGGTPASAPEPNRANALQTRTVALQDKLHARPTDAGTWAELGATYTELARAGADPSYYVKAQGALEESLRIKPDDNGDAMLGQGALANARHDFGAARDWGLKAQAVRPDSAEVQGVLVDAYTQLGDDAAATTALQRMLDLRPGVASFTRASYHFELHGRDEEAKQALDRALTAASSADEQVFCHYYLGELAFNRGDLTEAAHQYDQGLGLSPHDVTSLQGKAKVAGALGRFDEAIAGYKQVVSRVPVPQFLLEYAELLDLAGKPAEAAAQYAILAEQKKLLAAQGANDDLTLTTVAADHGDPAEALRLAQEEWGRRQSVLAADAMAWALQVNGRHAEALEFSDKASVLGWHNAAFSFHRGMILASLDRGPEAVAALTQALSVNPYFSPLHAPAARAKLAELETTR